MPNAATMRRNAMPRHVLLHQTGKKESRQTPECPGDRHDDRRDPRAKPAFKVRKKKTSLSQFLAH
jgi:hypothetical protein